MHLTVLHKTSVQIWEASQQTYCIVLLSASYTYLLLSAFLFAYKLNRRTMRAKVLGRTMRPTWLKRKQSDITDDSAPSSDADVEKPPDSSIDIGNEDNDTSECIPNTPALRHWNGGKSNTCNPVQQQPICRMAPLEDSKLQDSEGIRWIIFALLLWWAICLEFRFGQRHCT